MIKYFITLLVLACITQCAKLPKSWKKCKQFAPDLNECLRDAIQYAVRDLKDGKPEFGILSLDPLRIDLLVIEQGTGPVSLKLSFKDLDLIGHKNATILSVKNDWKDVYIEAVIPQLKMIGKYKMEGKVLQLPISGEGPCVIECDNFTASIHLTLKKYIKNGKEYLNVETYNFISDGQTGRLHFDNLFNGDKTLGDVTNRFLNENWKEILNEINPAFSKSFGTAYKLLANNILSRVPAENLFAK